MKDKKFLEAVAGYIIKENDDLEKQIVVVPNIRAGLYLKKYLASLSDKPGWAPEILSVQDFFHRESEIESEEQIPLIFELFKSFNNVKPSLFDSFDSFYPWGEIILSDFNDIDKNLVDYRQLFTNIADLKKIDLLFPDLDKELVEKIKEFWINFDEQDLNESKKRFYEIWDTMPEVYKDYTERLEKMKLGYEGMIYKKAAENLNSQLFPDEKPNYYFVGFNVLSKAEEIVFKIFKNQHGAKFFWQYDNDLLNDEIHEAFRFINRNLSNFPSPEDFNYSYNSRAKNNFNVYSVSSNTAQVKYASKLLEEEISEIDPGFEKTGVILPDETLLQPALFSVPDKVKHLNVTMGLNISSTPQYSIISLLSSLQENYSSTGFYYKDVLKILNNPLIKRFSDETMYGLPEEITEKNLIRVGKDRLAQNDLFLRIFDDCSEVIDLGNYFSDTLKIIYESLDDDDVEFDKEVVYQMFRNINRFNEYLIKDRIHFKYKSTYLRLLNTMLSNVKIAFSGEPMKGLQVMGMLETRLIDFDNLIILSMNEGHFPGQSFKRSFVPYNLRKAFGLPTIELQDAIHAYYFYRMIMYPDNVFLIYNTSTEGMNKGEKSRYIQQLNLESEYKISEIPVHLKAESSLAKTTIIEKDDFAMKILGKYYSEQPEHSFSASQLNTYINCPLEFYYKYILGAEEPDEVTEQMGSLEFGNLIHKAMELIYQNYRGKNISEAELKLLFDDDDFIQSKVDEAYQIEMKSGAAELTEGLNAIALKIIIKYIKRILNFDIDDAPVKYIEGEKQVSSYLVPAPEYKHKKVRIKGTIDHLDISDGKLRVVDYKTGRLSDKSKPDNEKLFNRSDNQYDHYLQVSLYSWLSLKSLLNQPEYENLSLSPKLYYVQANRVVDTFVADQDIEDPGYLNDLFESDLKKLISEILNQDVPFSGENSKVCKNCKFNRICN